MTDLQLYTNLMGSQATKYAVAVSAFTPFITTDNYTFGQIDRFFVRQVNQPTALVVEVDEPTFNQVNGHPFYVAVSLTWRISGSDKDQFDGQGIRIYTGVSTANRTAIAVASQTIGNLNTKLPNVYQFWRGF